ncbi:hypothetical protein SG34_009595 [Thalassomonas viridans]|uniref:YCII-related domain-containing protein n=1 Tax=Thalassomonas viridans TaxID=137584 RepID=A0AAE9Z6X3_9GAMM|nr:hypothetical protein [Thalassomonas viridans]WDE07114.1 hypothetical protein SG34_009595 [Thalassomonas viridans]
MANYLFVYHGGEEAAPEELESVMQAWRNWFAGMGDAVIDSGNPVGLSTTVTSDGSIVNNGGSNPASGYSLIAADNIEEACAHAKACPILASNGSIEIAEIIDMQ